MKIKIITLTVISKVGNMVFWNINAQVGANKALCSRGVVGVIISFLYCLR